MIRVNASRRSAWRIGRLLPTIAASLSSSGCLAMSLSGRGAPDSAMREIAVSLESVHLPDHGMGHEGGMHTRPVWVTFPESGWIHGWSYTLTDEAGDSLPRGVLHHFKIMNPARRELFSAIMLHVVGAGGETTPFSLPNSLGYRVEKGDSVLVTAMLHNPTGHDLHGVHMQATLRYSSDGRWRPPLAVVPFFVHVTTDMSVVDFDIPPGRSERSIDVTPSIDCRVLGLGAHLHRYARSVTVTDPTEGKVLWEGEAELAEDGTVLAIPQDYFVWSGGLELKKGRSYRITTRYDNPTGQTIAAGGMATIGGVVLPDEPWPAVDVSSDEYQWYLQRELTWGPVHAP